MRILSKLKIKQKWLLISGLVLVMGSVAGWAWYYRPVVADMSYDACDITYGEVVGEWAGSGEDEWNMDGMHYQVRRFSMESTAPEVFFPNTIEREPTRIATGGEHRCREDFNEEIDTTANEYRYRGSRAVAVRFGVPDFGEVNSYGSFFDSTKHAQDNFELTTPVYETDGEAAAAWVDDGGSAHVMTNGEEYELLWCINAEGCDDIASQSNRRFSPSGHGFQFVSDNCPVGVVCDAEWHRSEVLTDVTKDKERGLRPFSLRLSAVSTRAPQIGAEHLLVFAHPIEVEFDANIHSDTTDLEPGDELDLKLEVRKRGPGIETMEVQAEANDQPVQSVEIDFTDDELMGLNQLDQASFSLSLDIDEEAENGCYELPFHIKLHSGAETVEEQRDFDYCVEGVEEIEEVEEEESSDIERRDITTVYTYRIATRGNTHSSISQFRTQAAETLHDSRGWVRAGVSFREVESGGDFILWLAAPSEMTSFSSGCSPDYSCRVGEHVIINDQRWQNGTEAWNQAGGSIRDYRHMVINHETGHFLGHGHFPCPGAGQPAPVMQQQSINLNGCQFNPWPLPFEIDAL